MNRQERRLREREQRLDRKAEQRIMKRQEMANHLETELYFTCFGLAVNELHGWEEDKIRELWGRADAIVGEFRDGKYGDTLDEFKRYVLERTGIQCRFS